MRVRSARDCKALAGLLLFWALFCGCFLLSESSSIQWDMLDLHHPALHALARAFAEGRLPHWTPHLASGYPLLSDPEVAAFYPPVTLAAALGPPGPKTLAVLVCLHLLVAAIGLYALARAMGASWGGAWIGALGYGFGGFLVGNASHLGMQGAAAWLPWLLLAWIRSRKGSLRWMAGGATFLALAALAGHFQTVLFCLLALATAAVMEAWHSPRPGQVVLRLFAICLFAGGLAAVQILPAARLGLASPRRHLSYGDTSAPRLHLASLANLFFADGFGGVSGTPYVGPWDRTQHYFYPGVTVSLLALLGLLLGPPKRRITLGLPLLLVWLYCAGGGLHWLIWTLVPGFASIRGPVNAAFLAQFLLCLSAALFWRDLRRRVHDRLTLTLGGILLLLVSTGLLLRAWDHASPWGAVRSTVAGLKAARDQLLVPSLLLGWVLGLLVLAAILMRPRALGRPLTLCLLLLSMADLYGHGASRNHLFASREKVAKRLKGETESPWLATLKRNPAARFHDLDVSSPLLDWRALIHGVNSTLERTPLRSRYYDEYLQATETNPRLFDQLGVMHFIVPTKNGKEVRPTRGRPLFPFTLAGRLRIVKDDESSRKALRDLHPPEEAIVLEGDPFPRDLEAGRLSILGLDLDRKGARLRFHASRRGMLVHASTWHPSWRAFLDGVELPIHRVDHALMGVLVPAGSHRIEWIFDDDFFSVGAGLSLLCLGLLVGLALHACLPLRAFTYA